MAAEELKLFIAAAELDGRLHLGFSQHFSEQQYIEVVIQNVSRKIVRIWAPDNSEGYDNLSFEMVDKTNQRYAIRRQTISAWNGNCIDWVTLKPDEVVVRKVDLHPERWLGLPNLLTDEQANGSLRARVRAILSIPQTRMTALVKVWTGTVSSQPREFEIRKESGYKKRPWPL